MKHSRIITSLSIVILPLSIGVTDTHADIVLDGTTGVGGALAGPDFVVTEAMGRRVDNTLLHSFSDFSLSSNELALFTGDSAITNVISRVTGNSASTIDGTVETELGAVDFWFINPNGVVFGENASINVGGAFQVTTADGLILENGTVFDTATDLSSPTLTVAAPESFHFLSDNAASIEIMSGAIGDDQIYLDFSSATDVTFAAGNIDILSAKIDVPNGALNLVASGAASVPITNFTTVATPSNSHNVVVTESEIRVGGDENGALNVLANTFEVNDSSELFVTLSTDSTLNTQTVKISDGALLALDINDNAVNADFNIITGVMEVSADASLSTETASDINNIQGADIRISARSTLINEGVIESRVGSNVENSTGGDIYIESQTLLLTGNGGTLSIVDAGAAGSVTGDITVIATEMMTISDGGSISQSEGSGGQITLSAPTIQAINTSNALTTIYDDNNAPSNVSIMAENLLLDNASLNTRVTENSVGGSFIVDAHNLTMRNDSVIKTETIGAADGVDLEISANHVSLTNGSTIESNTFAGGKGGTINLNVSDTVILDGFNQAGESAIRSTTADLALIDPNVNQLALLSRQDLANGSGGLIRINADTIKLQNGAKISALSGFTDDVALGRTVDSGNAGTIELVANKLTIKNESTVEMGSLESSGGDVDIRIIDFIGITDSAVTVNSQGATIENLGGDIFIDPELLLLKNANISAQANGANGGNVDVIADTIIKDDQTELSASLNLDIDIDGSLSIEGVTNEVSEIAAVEIAFDDISTMLSQQCNIAALSDRSSFVTGRRKMEDNSPSNYQAYSSDIKSKYIAVNADVEGGDMRLAYLINHKECD